MYIYIYIYIIYIIYIYNLYIHAHSQHTHTHTDITEICCFPVSTVSATTVPSHTYNQLSKSMFGQNAFVVRVQACRDAHIALSELFNNVQSRTYEIIIGGNANMNSFIRDAETFHEKIRVDTPNILDCNNYRTFWVKWESDYTVTVGQGAVINRNTFLDWNDAEQRVFRGITISTYYGAEGLWEFSFLEGNFFSFRHW